MPRSRSKKVRRRRSHYIRHRSRKSRVSRRRRRVSRRQMRGGSNQWTCARKSSKDNKLYETVSPGENIQRLLSDNRLTTSRPLSSDSITERTNRAAEAAKRAKLVPSQARTKKSTTNSSIKQRTKRTASAAKHAKLVPSQVLTS